MILSSREEVIQMSKSLAKWQTPGMAESGTQCALVVEAKEYEVSWTVQCFCLFEAGCLVFFDDHLSANY